MKLPFLSNFSPGTAESVSSEPATLGPTPDKNNRFPTRRACGYNPTGLGALFVEIRFCSDIFNALGKYTKSNRFCLQGLMRTRIL
jgi:hypothetical protein